MNMLRFKTIENNITKYYFALVANSTLNLYYKF